MRFVLLVLLLALLPNLSRAQNHQEEEKLEALADSVLTLISGAPGDNYNWEALGELFDPNARFIAQTDSLLDSNRSGNVIISLEVFLTRFTEQYEQIDFFEIPIETDAEVHLGTGTVRQSYRTQKADGTPISSGVNFIQFIRVKGEWKIIQVLWSQDG